MAEKQLKIIPLGGVSEIGKNCLVMQYGKDAIMIDAGVMFPNDEMLGVDLIIPDVSYLLSNEVNLLGIFLTHGHEDHIGALPYILNELDPAKPLPVYGTRLTLGLVRADLAETRNAHLADLRNMEPYTPVEIGPFQVEALPVGHSIPDAASLAIHTPIGTIMFTGDWKFAGMPAETLARLQAIGQNGLQMLIPDCVRIESTGHTPGEEVVAATIARVIMTARGRVIITTFASNLQRIGEVIAAAATAGRVVALVGRSMEQYVAVARELGYLVLPEGIVLPVDQVRNLPPSSVVLITTGSQGEPAAALSRIAAGEHRLISIIPGDTVVFSATPIPGNEETVGHTIDNLFRAGADVLYSRTTPMIHVSGHAGREEHGELLSMLKPKYVVPWHGEYRMMMMYRKLAQESGIDSDHVCLLELGDVLTVSKNHADVTGKVTAGSTLVDGLTVGEVNQVVLRDRRQLASEGLVIASVVVDSSNGEIINRPELIMLGLPPSVDGEFAEDARTRVMRSLERRTKGNPEPRLIGEVIKNHLSGFIYQRTGLRPMILPVITEV